MTVLWLASITAANHRSQIHHDRYLGLALVDACEQGAYPDWFQKNVFLVEDPTAPYCPIMDNMVMNTLLVHIDQNGLIHPNLNPAYYYEASCDYDLTIEDIEHWGWMFLNFYKLRLQQEQIFRLSQQVMRA